MRHCYLYLYISSAIIMKLLLDIKDSKAEFMMELLSSFSFVKAEKLSPAKAQFLKELKASAEEVVLAKEGKIQLQSARDFLNEL